MVVTLVERNLSLGWLASLEHLLACGGTDVNVIVAIERIGEEDGDVRGLLDTFIAPRRGRTVLPVSSVANTIFPHALYQPGREGARERLYELFLRGYPVARRFPANYSGTYFHRLVAWPGPTGPVNQLERAIARLWRQMGRRNPLRNAYELGLSNVGDDWDEIDDATAELRIQLPGRDGRLMGFPCLSHVSLTLLNGRLHATALYRNQHFIRKAYGNYLGLSRLLQFLCQEVGCQPGELVCISSHADAEIGTGRGFGQGDLRGMAQACRRAVGAGGLGRVSA